MSSLIGSLLIVAGVLHADVQLIPLGGYAHTPAGMGAAEIAAYAADNHLLFVVNGAAGTVDVLQLSDPRQPALVRQVKVAGSGETPTSVAVQGGTVLVAVKATHSAQRGWLRAYDLQGQPLFTARVGHGPDMVTFAGPRRALVANEGEPLPDGSSDPPGSVSLVEWQGDGTSPAEPPRVDELTFDTLFPCDPREATARSIRAAKVTDLEPEYIAVSPHGDRAWVTLQENNAIGIIDLQTRQVIGLVGLGFKDHSQTGCGLDGCAADGQAHITTWPVWGMYQPDGIASFQVGGRSYLITANEGDVRSFEGYRDCTPVSELQLEATAFPQGDSIQAPGALGSLLVANDMGDDDADGRTERLFCFGTRSVSVWSPSGESIWDSGDLLERVTADRLPAIFNSNSTADTFDSRSDDHGPEPEGIAVGTIDDIPYAFVGLERIGAIAVFRLDDPTSPQLVDLYHGTQHQDAVAAPAPQFDIGPEGLVFVGAAASPTKQPLLIACFEVSGTTRVLSVVGTKPYASMAEAN